MKNILKEITDCRVADIEKKGFAYAHKIPENRNRPVVTFLKEAGTILEIKRASPSKGDIAINLNVEKIANDYINAGTSAISVLTEENYFKGSLEDLKKVSELAGDKVAVLRKDFLLFEQDIEIAYRCGADAVLLIARILETEKLLCLARKAFDFGLSVLLELRDDEAVFKAFEVLALAKKMNSEENIVLGINARDLKTFSIDMLIPLKIKCKIEQKILSLSEQERPEKIKIISESGILTKDASVLCGYLGFDGVLIGEAVAKNPDCAKDFVKGFLESRKNYKKNSFWEKIARKLNEKESEKKYRPLVKICGITNEEDALCAVECGADLLGFVFEKKFARHVELEKVWSIKQKVVELCRKNNLNEVLFVAVITDPSSQEADVARKFFEENIIDAIQFHGCSGNFMYGYEAFRLGEKNQLEELKSRFENGSIRILLDSYIPDVQGGSGVQIQDELLQDASKISKLWLAGGINSENVKNLVEKYHPELIDVSSSVEKEIGKKDRRKLTKFFNALI